MTIALRSNTSAATTTPGTTLTLAKPSGLANGDLLILQVARYNDAASAVNVTWSSPGFTVLPGIARGAAASMGGCLLYKWITDAGSEPANYTVTITPTVAGPIFALAGGAAAWTGVNPTTPFDVAAALQTQTSLDVIAPSISTVTDGAVLLFLGRVRRTLTFTPPTGMTEVWDVGATGGTAASQISSTLAYQLLGAPGATGTRTGSISGGIARENDGILVALRPALVGLSCRVRVGGAWVTGTVRRIA